jgi:hypothetical protein
VGKKSVRLASRKSIGRLVDVSYSVEKSRSLKFCITGEKKGCCGTEVDCPALKLIVWADSV